MRRRLPEAALLTVPVVLVLVGAVVLGIAITSGTDPAPFSQRARARLVEPTASGEPGGPHRHHARRPVPQSVGPATGSACLPRTQHSTITVVTYNIHSALGHGRGVQLATIAEEIKRWHVDVALLQEVDRFRGWTGRVDMPSVLAGRLGFSWAFGDNVRGADGSQYGTAILSRFPIESAHNTLLPAPGGTQQRGLLHVRLDIGGSPLSVYDTHLEHTSPTARLAQIRRIMPILAADPLPKLLGGDLNSTPWSPVLAVARTGLIDAWAEAGAGQGRTVPKARIDYLLHAAGDGTGELVPRLAEVLASQVSDHSALWVRYRLTSRAGEVCVPLLGDG